MSNIVTDGQRSGSEFDTVRDLLLEQRWIFASTMPGNPHEHSLRKNWTSDAAFVQTVEFIRGHGYRAVYEGRSYIQLDVNEHFYWTMGGPLRQTILINRKVRKATVE